MTVIAHGPICNACGVEYVEEGDRQNCTEPGCAGRVSWEVALDASNRQLRGAVDLLREAHPHIAQRIHEPGVADLLERVAQAVHACRGGR